ncbi:hypothetical protein [Alpinimonas psychrophila]|uniref:Uncharacterized protein n=1 Tax=Alpinimonas psychrophila TaxID=748908 RepID=A0A7W3JS87_9MICO|nr:hypothetical protein [Alpinimonas psychrophila]MBA8828265.1 hypothetical protein [Alpinimonas psychrophila]
MIPLRAETARRMVTAQRVLRMEIVPSTTVRLAATVLPMVTAHRGTPRLAATVLRMATVPIDPHVLPMVTARSVILPRAGTVPATAIATQVLPAGIGPRTVIATQPLEAIVLRTATVMVVLLVATALHMVTVRIALLVPPTGIVRKGIRHLVETVPHTVTGQFARLMGTLVRVATVHHMVTVPTGIPLLVEIVLPTVTAPSGRVPLTTHALVHAVSVRSVFVAASSKRR